MADDPLRHRDRLAVLIAAGNGWQRYELSADGDGGGSCVTDDGANVSARWAPLPDAGPVARWRLEVEVTADRAGGFAGVQVLIPLDASLQCVWKPHLAPVVGQTIGDRAFRSPVIALENADAQLALVPDLDLVRRDGQPPAIMDFARDDDPHLILGVSEYSEVGHVYYELRPRWAARRSPVRFAAELWVLPRPPAARDLRAIESLLWERCADRSMAVAPSLESLAPYIRHAYRWAFDTWRHVCWQEFRMAGGARVGGVTAIVRARQKAGLGHEQDWREPKSLWNQAWFSSLRSAYGYALWGRELGRADWGEKARLALAFALSAPRVNGLFPSYYQAGEDGSWENGAWQMSAPRRPDDVDGFVHLLDASWTCCWMLKWYRDVEPDERILPFVVEYAERLLRLQLPDGAFPAWVEPHSLTPSAWLRVSSETSMHVMLLCLLHQFVPDRRYIEASRRAGRFVRDRVVAEGRWEDFETYWSCGREWAGRRYGQREERSGLYNQCNFGIYWTAEAFRSLYLATGEGEYLDQGEQVLAELSLYQQIWQPPYLPVPTLGGFGVMNSDDEWNDARSSLFAVTYQGYYEVTGDERYSARARWAMRSSFAMMLCPENPEVRELFAHVHPELDEGDYGFQVENFNHHDGTEVDGLAEFSIFDWGCGSAAASLAELTFVAPAASAVRVGAPDASRRG